MAKKSIYTNIFIVLLSVFLIGVFVWSIYKIAFAENFDFKRPGYGVPQAPHRDTNIPGAAGQVAYVSEYDETSQFGKSGFDDPNFMTTAGFINPDPSMIIASDKDIRDPANYTLDVNVHNPTGARLQEGTDYIRGDLQIERSTEGINGFSNGITLENPEQYRRLGYTEVDMS